MFKIITIDELLLMLDNYNHKELHVHHTYLPNKAKFEAKPDGLYWQEAMRKYHMMKPPNGCGWSDIAQHVTLLPDGMFVTGRDFNRSPASITGYNLNSFAVEMLGNFDVEKLEGEQLKSIQILARYFDQHGKYVRFHRENSPKTCPGKSIDKETFVKQVRGEPVKYTKGLLGPHIIEVDPLNITSVLCNESSANLAKKYKNYINGMFYASDNRVYCLLVVNGKKLADVKPWDIGDKGTLIIYNDGRVEVKTLYTINDVSKIKLAIQGFNLNYEANQSKTLGLSVIKEGWQADVMRKNFRPGIGYNPVKNKIIIALENTDAAGIRKTLRALGCIDANGDTLGLGLDSGGSTALCINGKVISTTSRNQRNILIFN